MKTTCLVVVTAAVATLPLSHTTDNVWRSRVAPHFVSLAIVQRPLREGAVGERPSFFLSPQHYLTRAMNFLELLSAVFGWIYTLCWSLSFYPQLLLNLRRRSTAGTTVDFPFINVLGFAAYFASNVAFYYSPLIQAQYAARNHGLRPTVQFNDIAFALHAALISSITLSQYLLRPVWGFEPTHGTRPSRFILGASAGCVLGVVVTWFIAIGDGEDAATDWCELDVIYAVGYVKLLVTLIKFAPQLLINFRNKSTKGWSISQITLDFTGGVLSATQQCIDSYLQHDWSGITGNPVKFALANISMIYDVLFMTQHYVLYPADKAGRATGQREPLLGENPAADPEDQRRRQD